VGELRVADNRIVSDRVHTELLRAPKVVFVGDVEHTTANAAFRRSPMVRHTFSGDRPSLKLLLSPSPHVGTAPHYSPFHRRWELCPHRTNNHNSFGVVLLTCPMDPAVSCQEAERRLRTPPGALGLSSTLEPKRPFAGSQNASTTLSR
jgi:hypothetical protein